MNILNIQNLKVYFLKESKVIKALDGIDLFLEENQITALIGESGCGKTTLAKTILGFYKPTAGKIFFKDFDITLKKNEPIIRKNIQIVFQNPSLSLDPRYRIYDTIYEALFVFRKLNKIEAKEIIEKAMYQVGLDKDILYRYPHQLSGGQLQRVCIARSLINKPSIVVLDEPTSSLDITNASKIIKLLEDLQKTNKLTFLFISHNLKLLRKISTFCFIMYKGKIVEYGPKELIFRNPLHPYTKLLIEASNFRLKDLGRNTDFFDASCSFYGRCEFKKDICKKNCQKIEVEKNHIVFCNLFN
ncbi:MAG: ABC transporter ATP-binding protein [Candidatus Omnitrophica bacterium]|nr:ABC transporter ATP-binding protein [Candidatus Omnitrophota bacterium]MCM8831393.1 ABC transporter ATP-binding protein [Candidatus Omnitrophota bacterium]